LRRATRGCLRFGVLVGRLASRCVALRAIVSSSWVPLSSQVPSGCAARQHATCVCSAIKLAMSMSSDDTVYSDCPSLLLHTWDVSCAHRGTALTTLCSETRTRPTNPAGADRYLALSRSGRSAGGGHPPGEHRCIGGLRATHAAWAAAAFQRYHMDELQTPGPSERAAHCLLVVWSSMSQTSPLHHPRE
jgi:hypothetical protein